ncbi:hypothetical protein LDENG_00168140 [Lucifuga dentata]|nr:hypothetical protein LDENG_00168140 [Lucifuga dentata]
MATRELSALESWCDSHLKIVLLGGRNSGKSSVGNFILGKEEFVIKERTTCSRRLGVVAGRWVTVVDTPGWWCDFSAQDTSELVKREIVSSISLCSPGPHVFLITVKANSFLSEKRRRAVEEHVALLGEKVWSHCIVILTSDNPKQPRLEEQAQGKALHWLSEKCSQRHHSVTLKNDGTNNEVTELLVKIQKLVMKNGNRTFEMQEVILQAIAERKKTVEEKAQQRFVRMKKHRALMQERLHHLSEIRIVLVGAKGSGKSSAMNTIMGREANQQFRRTAQCLVGQGSAFGRQVTIVDTPGWWMNYFCDESPIFDQRQILFSVSLCPPGPHVFLLVIRVDRAFTETYRRSVQEHMELISDQIWSHVIVLFNFGDWLGCTTTEQYIESEGEPLRWLFEKCGNRYHILNNKTKGDGFQVQELIEKIEETVAANSGQHYEMERNKMKQLEERMRTEKDRAKERLMKKQKQRQMARSQMEKLNPLPELRIVLLGGRNTGKSSSGNTILGTEWFDTEGQTTSCTEKRSKTSGKIVTVVDTPSCLSVSSDLLMSHSYLTAVLLVVNVSSSFTHSHMEDIEKRLEAVGGDVWSRAMVLFSYGDWLGNTNIEQHIESEGDPLQRLVERCGNRHHTLDNKNSWDGAQVKELLELIEEMLVEERLGIFQRGDHIQKRISLEKELQPDGATLYKEDLKELTSQTGQLSHDSSESSFVYTSARCWWPNSGTTRDSRRMDSTTDHHPEQRQLQGQHSCLRERTLRRITKSGGLQALIDQWGDSNLEELEAFIDSYFEMVWEQTMAEPDPPTHAVPVQDAVIREQEQEVLSSIDRKLSKLDLLEEIQRDLAALRQSLERSWKAIKELRDKSKLEQDANKTC